MSVGVLLVTHEGIASCMLAAARRVIRVMPLKVGVFEVPWDVGDGVICTRTLRQELRDLDEGQGVLVLADIYGATPFNLAAEHEPGRRAEIEQARGGPHLHQAGRVAGVGRRPDQEVDAVDQEGEGAPQQQGVDPR